MGQLRHIVFISKQPKSAQRLYQNILASKSARYFRAARARRSIRGSTAFCKAGATRRGRRRHAPR